MPRSAIIGTEWKKLNNMSINKKNLEKLKNKKIAFYGLGIENFALIEFIQSRFLPCRIIIRDLRPKEELGQRYKRLKKNRNIFWKLGTEQHPVFAGQDDIIFRSPGWPLFCPEIKSARRNGVEISSPLKLFFQLCPTKSIIGVTGTKGKGTTSSLIFEILKKAGKRAWLGGNIGIAPFDFIDKIQKEDWVVLELSSFQLEDFDASPRIAVITNFSKEHLAAADPNNPNFHKSLRAYWNSKFNIVKFQKKTDFAVINKKIELRIKKQELRINSKIIYFEKANLKSQLVGEHNKENIAAAVEVAKILKIPKNKLKKAIAGFKGLPHRIEFVKNINGTAYYEDSFATIPESAIIALKSFADPIILIAGGAEKKSDFKNFAKEIKKRVKFLILLAGDATPRLKKEVIQAGFDAVKIHESGSMVSAVQAAKKEARAGDVVLLSTGCASFGMFKNYKERGDQFKEEVFKNKK